MKLRDYQAALLQQSYAEWDAGKANVMPVLPTGGGKTVIFAHAMEDESGPSIAVAHRRELVSQMSLTLARNGLRHDVIGPPSLLQLCAKIHAQELGQVYTQPGARRSVASVFSLANVGESDPLWSRNRLWIHDEGHHILKDNIFGKVVSRFRQAHGMAPTATPMRADGRGLGRHADGLMDVLVEGPSMRTLIDRKFLTEYRIFCPPSDLDLAAVPVGSGGDYQTEKLGAATMRSSILGDCVKHYQQIAAGKLGVTFAPTVEVATILAGRFREAGVPAEVVTAKTPDALRASILRRAARREILQLVNVALFDEGFDLPAIEVVSDCAATMSYGRYAQRFGRMLRLLDGKTHGIYIDHVSNVHMHRLPDAPRVWTLDRRERRGKKTADDVVPVKTCPECLSAFERIYKACPFCGHAPEPSSRSAPEFVDGSLGELDAGTLAAMRGEIARVDAADPLLPYGAAPEVIGAIRKRHRERQEAQTALRETMALWGGAKTAEGMPLDVAQRLFWHRFGTDVATAQTLGRADAEGLREKIALTMPAVMANLPQL